MKNTTDPVAAHSIISYIESGIGVSVSAKSYSPHVLEMFLYAAQKGQSVVLLRDATTLAPHNLMELGAKAKGKLIVEL